MSINKGNIANALHSVAPDHVVVTADDIYDETLNKYQSELNQQIGQGGYNPPQGGIPKSDLSSSVQASLDKADAAVPNTRTVNGKALSSNITLNASDVGALPSSTTIPTSLSQLTDDTTHRTVTDSEKTNWSDKYTKTEVDNMISSAPESDVIVVEVPSGSDIATYLLNNVPAAQRPNNIFRVPGTTSYSEWAWNGTAFVQLDEKDYGIDDVPTDGSDNLVKSGGSYNQNIAVLKAINPFEAVQLTPISIEIGKWYNETGEHESQYFEYGKYSVEGGKAYKITSAFMSDTSIYFLSWVDANGNFIGYERSYKGNRGAGTAPVYLDKEPVIAPANAAYAYLNCSSTVGYNVLGMYEAGNFVNVEELREVISDVIQLAPSDDVSGTFIGYEGQYIQNASFGYKKFPVFADKMYVYEYEYGADITIRALYWADANNIFIGYSSMVVGPVTDTISVIAPANAAYAYLNYQKTFKDVTNLYKLGDYIKSKDLKEQIIKLPTSDNIQKIIDNIQLDSFSILTPVETISGKYMSVDGLKDNNYFSVQKYDVVPGELYDFDGRFADNIKLGFIYWKDADGNDVGGNNFFVNLPAGAGSYSVKHQLVIAPANAAYAYLNQITDEASKDNFRLVITDRLRLYNLRKDLATATESISLTPISIEIGKWYNETGEHENQYFKYGKYSVEGGKAYKITSAFTSDTSIYFLSWVDANGNFIGYERSYKGNRGAGTAPVYLDKEPVIAPANAAYAYLNCSSVAGYDNMEFYEAGDFINTEKLIEQFDYSQNKQMKVVINTLSRDISTQFNNEVVSDIFHVRTKYNSEKDIIIGHYINGNQLISFSYTWIGPKALSDAEIMTSVYLVSSHTDSTAPFLHARTYWHIYAQHGCPMPRFNNNTQLTSADVGSLWKDQLDRQFRIGLVTDDSIFLVPVMYQDNNGHWVRDWRNTVDDSSRPVTSLAHVSGGTHTSAINTITDFRQVQVRPVMASINRKWVADGKEITEHGTYYCDDFNVSESAIGYAPETITNWFGATGNNVDLTGAQPLAEFTFSYNYKGAQCCVNTTLHVIREIEMNSYGAIQQQFFLDNGDYKAMFLIPKAKSRYGIEIDKPFNSPATNSQSYLICRNSNDLKDVNEQVDRQIGYLYNPNTGDYLVGMAAGLSLVSGDTIKEKRNQNIPIGDTFRHLNLNFSPSNTNKFYVSALSSVLFEDHDYYFQPGLFKEINYYVSYFDPAENVGQVYWYKDGSKYVIYCHCQSIQNALAINVPEIMEGLRLAVVEKTNNTDLLTDTIQNGKFFVNYNTVDANYIVLKAE